MALNSNEQTLLEAVRGLLSQDALGMHFKSDEETSHTSQFRWEGIDDAFALKVSGNPFFESLTSAFYAVHAHKYIDHPTFKLALVSELKNRAVPEKAIEEAVSALDGIINEMSAKQPSERDAGWNPAIDEIADMTRNADTRKMERPEPFTGGGPWVESIDQDYYKLMLIEGIVGEDETSQKMASRYSRLKAAAWPMAKPHLIQLAEDANSAGMVKFSREVERYVNEQDSAAVKKIVEG